MVFGEYCNQEVISQDYYYSEVLLRFGFQFLYFWLERKKWKKQFEMSEIKISY